MILNKLKKIFFVFFNVVFISSFIVIATFLYYGKDLPSEKTLLEYSPPATAKILSSNGELIEEYAIERRVIVNFEKIPIIVKGAFLIAEDREFYNHPGISIQSLLRAIVENTAKKSWNKKPAGGSTITQQIAKNLLVGNKRSISRKIKEAIMAFRIESTISKNKILEIYLNQLYLGKGCYGIAEAAEYYFGKSLEKILPAEAAFLASIPSAPSVYINSVNSSKLLTKRNSILYQMYEMGYISKNQLKMALATPISIKSGKNKIFSPYFSDEIFKIISQKMSQEEFFRKGYVIKTTMNKKIQEIVTEAFEDGLINFTKTQRWKGTIDNIKNNMEAYKERLEKINKDLPSTINKIMSCLVTDIKKDRIVCQTQNNKIEIKLKNEDYKGVILHVADIILCRFLKNSNEYEIYQTPEVTGGAVVMDTETGNILGMTGGYSFDISPFNCITQAKRQPGSTIKPFVYATALEEGVDEYDIIEDKPVTITLSSGEKYSPHNYNDKCYGQIPIRDGLIYSRNLSTINLALSIGIAPISKLLKEAHLICKKMPVSGVLGSIEVFPINLLAAFSAFVNEGTMVFPRFIEHISQTTATT
jgi:penicillin-binding protein 1A